MATENEIFALLKAQGLTDQQAMAYVAALIQPQPTDPYLGGFEGDYKDANRAVDYGRDVNTLLADPMTGAAAGLGGFGGGMIGVDAFMPVREYVEGPRNQRLQAYLAKPLDSLEGWMADIVTREGVLGLTAAAQQYLTYDDPSALAPEQQKIWQQLQQFKYTDPMSGESRLDLGPLRGIASDLEQEAYLQADPNANFDPETGQWYVEKPSEMQEKFDKLGLPSPTLQYGLEDFTPEGAQLQNEADTMRALIGEREQTGVYDQLDKTAKDAYTRYMMLRENGGPETAFGDAASNALSFMQRGPQQPGHQPQPTLPTAPDSGQGAMDMGLTAQMPDIQAPTAFPYGQYSGSLQGAFDMGGLNQPVMGVGPGVGVGMGAQPPAAGPQQQALPPGIGRLLSQGLARNPARDQRITSQREERNKKALAEANQQFLDASRAKWNSGKSGHEMRASNTEKRAKGYKSMNDYRQGTNKQQDAIGQGRMDFNIAQAQGRTPLSDTLRQRALAAYLLGG